MFSRRERDFLGALVRCEGEGDVTQRRLVEAFPSSTYRRKMLWGIRRKAVSAAADWELYVRAARVESKVLPGPVPSESPPLAADPLVTLGRTLRGYLKTNRHTERFQYSRPRNAARSETRR